MTIRKITNVTTGLVTLADLRTPATFVHRATLVQGRITAAEVTQTPIIKATAVTARPVTGISFIDRYANNYRDVATLLDALGITTVKQLVDGTALLDTAALFLQYAPQRNFTDTAAIIDDLVSLILLANRSPADQVIVGQELQLFFDKYQRDVVNPQDRQRFDVAAAKSLSVAAADRSRLSVARTSQDQTQIDDRLEFANRRNLFDDAITTSKLAWLANIDKRHSVALSSVKAFSIVKPQQDQTAADDRRALLLQRPLLDNNTVTDLPSLQPEPRKFELITVTDDRLGFFIGKGIRDDQGLTDLFRAFDGLTYTMTYSLRDSFGFDDFFARRFTVVRGVRDGFADTQTIDQRSFKTLARPVRSTALTTRDVATRSIGRGINDALNSADIDRYVLSTLRTEEIALTDADQLRITNLRAHNVQLDDVVRRSVTILKRHSFTATDRIAFGGGFALRDSFVLQDAQRDLFVKSRAHGVTITRTTRLFAGKRLTELISSAYPEPPLYTAFVAPVYDGFRLLTDVIISRTNVVISSEDIADNATSQGGRLLFTGFGGERQITFAPVSSRNYQSFSIPYGWVYEFTAEFQAGVPNNANGLEQPDAGEDLILSYQVNNGPFVTACTLWAGANDWGSTVGTSNTLTTSVSIQLNGASQSSVTWKISQVNYSNPGYDQYAIRRAFAFNSTSNWFLIPTATAPSFNRQMSLADVVRINDNTDASATPVRQVYLFDRSRRQLVKVLRDQFAAFEDLVITQFKAIPPQQNTVTIGDGMYPIPNYGKLDVVEIQDTRRQLFIVKRLADDTPALDLVGVFDGLVYQTIMLKTDNFTQPDFFARSFTAIRGVRDGFAEIVRPGGFLSGGGASNNNDAAISPIYLDSQGTLWGPAGGASIGSPRSIPLQAGAGAASPTFTGSTGLAVITVANSATNIVFNVAGPTTWTVPAGVSSINIEVIGGGGGGLFQAPSSNFGGGGGAYAGTRNVSVTAGQTIYINVAGTQGFGSSAAVYSWINLNANAQPTTSSDGVRAPSGQNNTGVSVVYGGDSSLCIGAVVYRGGHSLFAGTGGGAAGPDGNGGNAGAGGGGGANGGTDATGTAPGLNGPRLGRSDPRESIAFNFNKDAKQSTSITISGWGTSITRTASDRDFIVIGDPTTVASGQSRRSGATLENVRYTINKAADFDSGQPARVVVGGNRGLRFQPSESTSETVRFDVTQRDTDTQIIGAGRTAQQVRFSGDLETAAFFFTTIARASTSYTITRKTIDSFGAAAQSSVQVTIGPRDNDAVGVFDFFDSIIFVGRGIAEFVLIGSGIDQRQSTLERISFLITRRMGDGQSVNGAPDFSEILERPFLTLFKRTKQGLNTTTVFGNVTVTADDTDRLFIGTNVPGPRVSGDVRENFSYFVDKSAKLGVVRTVAGWGTTLAGGTSSGDYVLIGDPSLNTNPTTSTQSRRSGATLENFRYDVAKPIAMPVLLNLLRANIASSSNVTNVGVNYGGGGGGGSTGSIPNNGRTGGSGAVFLSAPGLYYTTSYTSVGTFSWTAPSNVYYIDAVCVGGGGGGGSPGGGGGGGGLGRRTNIPVTPGASYTVVVGAGGLAPDAFLDGLEGGQSYFISPGVVAGFGGAGGSVSTGVNAAGGGFVGSTGGSGGAGGQYQQSGGGGGGGGGAGGFGSSGGAGGIGGNNTGGNGGGGAPASNGAGGGGGGGADNFVGGNGGGVLNGNIIALQGNNGAAGGAGTGNAGGPGGQGSVFTVILNPIDTETVTKIVTQLKTETVQPYDLNGIFKTLVLTAKAGASYTITRKTIDGTASAQSSVQVTIAPQQQDQTGVFDFFESVIIISRSVNDVVIAGSGLDQRWNLTERTFFTVTKFFNDPVPALDLVNVFDGLVYNSTLLTRDAQVIGSGATSASNRYLGNNENIAINFNKSAKLATVRSIAGWGTSVAGVSSSGDFVVIGDPTTVTAGQSRRSSATLENVSYTVGLFNPDNRSSRGAGDAVPPIDVYQDAITYRRSGLQDVLGGDSGFDALVNSLDRANNNLNKQPALSQTLNDVTRADIATQPRGESLGDLDPFGNINTLINRGTLRITNYVANIDYFESDYIGETRIIS